MERAREREKERKGEWEGWRVKNNHYMPIHVAQQQQIKLFLYHGLHIAGDSGHTIHHAVCTMHCASLYLCAIDWKTLERIDGH